jgi:hypothetical protein
MPDTPTFGRYTEIPYDRMTPEQQEGYRSLLETGGQLPVQRPLSPGNICAQPQARKSDGAARRIFPRRLFFERARA